MQIRGLTQFEGDALLREQAKPCAQCGILVSSIPDEDGQMLPLEVDAPELLVALDRDGCAVLIHGYRSHLRGCGVFEPKKPLKTEGFAVAAKLPVQLTRPLPPFLKEEEADAPEWLEPVEAERKLLSRILHARITSLCKKHRHISGMETLEHREVVERIHGMGRTMAGLSTPAEGEDSNWGQVGVDVLKSLHRCVTAMSKPSSSKMALQQLERHERLALEWVRRRNGSP